MDTPTVTGEKVPFWKGGEGIRSDLIYTTQDGDAIQMSRHTGLEQGHPLLDGICLNCGFDEKTCSCETPDIQNPRPSL